jgi:hypothetical protein
MQAPALLDLRASLVRLEAVVLNLAITRCPTSSTALQDQEDHHHPLTPSEAAGYLRKSQSWLYHNWKGLRLGFRSGSRVLFRRATLDRYLRSCERRSSFRLENGPSLRTTV